MARATFWSRFTTALSYGTAGTSADLMLTLQPGETLLRTVVTLDVTIDSTTTEYVDIGQPAGWAVDFGTSNVSATRYPLVDFSGISTRWLYIDQLICDVVNQQVVAGSVSYIARTMGKNRYTNIETQWRNDTAAAQYLWLTTQFGSPVYSNASLFGSASVQGLIMVAP